MSTIVKPALPDAPRPAATPQERFEFDVRVKQTLETITGRRAGKVLPLDSDASNDEIIAKINDLIARLM